VTRTILLVEDDESDVYFLREALKKAGVQNPLQVASDGQQAIDYFKGTGKYANREEFPLPSLVLLDLKLPHVMGLDVLKWIRQEPGTVPIVIILSASKDDADITTAYRLGANGYLVKPVVVSKLVEMAKSIKDFWLKQNTPPPAVQVEVATKLQAPASTHSSNDNSVSASTLDDPPALRQISPGDPNNAK
jgi:CheY-like chemotaxis protein